MNSRIYYCIIGCLVVGGLFLGIFLFPYYHQLSLMLMYDRQYSKALPRYERLFDSGERTPAIVGPLIQLQLEEAKDREAIAVATEYVKQHPDSAEARMILGKLLKDSAHQHAYLENLKELFRLNPSLENLREQRQATDYLGDTAQSLQILEQMLTWKGVGSEEYRALAYLYAARGDEARALDVLHTMEHKIPLAEWSPDDAYFAVAMFADAQQLDQATELADKLLAATRSKQMAIALAQALLDAKMPGQGLLLLDRLSEKEKADPEIVELRIGLLAADDRNQDDYWEYMRALYEHNELPHRFIPQMLDLSLSHEEVGMVESLLARFDADQLDELTVLRLIRLSLVRNQPKLAADLKAKLSSSYLDDYRVVAMGLSLASEPRAFVDKDWSRLNDRERILLAQVYEANQDADTARALLLTVQSWSTLEDILLPEIASLYIQMQLAPQGLALVEKLNENRRGSNAPRKWAEILFDTALGKTQEVLVELEQTADVTEATLELLEETAFQQHQGPLANILSNLLYEHYPSLENKSRLGKALVLDGFYEQGLGILQRLYETGRRGAAERYLSALAVATRHTIAYRTELDSLIRELLSRHMIPRERWRIFAFQLIEQQQKEEAVTIFYALAQGEPFANPEVESLLQLWGERPNDEQLDWIAARAASAESSERLSWLKYLATVNAPQRLVNLVREEDLADDQIADLYLQALVDLKDRCRLQHYLEYAVGRESRPPRLKKLGKTAQESDFLDLAELAYEKVLESLPDDVVSIVALGHVTFAKGDLSTAEWYLTRSMELGHYDYLVLYQYAEILWEDKKRQEARSFYQAALGVLQSRPTRALEAQRVEAQIYLRLNRVSFATVYLAALVMANPTDLSLRIDYANVLMDVDEYVQAAAILFDPNLFCYGKVDHPYQREQLEIHLLASQERYYKDQWCFGRALQISNYALQQYPEEERFWASRGQMEEVIGRWNRGMLFVGTAQGLAPDHEAYGKVLASIWDGHRPFLDVQAENRLSTPAQHERFNRLAVEGYVWPDLRWIVTAERDAMTLDAYTRFSDGAAVPFDGSRERGVIGLQQECESGLTLEGKLFWGDTVIGVGADGSFVDLWGRTTVLGEYHEPYWGITQSTIEYGVRNRIGVSRLLRLYKGLTIDVSGSYQQYNLYTKIPTARTWAAHVLLTYRVAPTDFMLRQMPEGAGVSYNYLMDIEMQLWQLSKTGLDGTEYQPLGFSNSALHTFFFGLDLPITPCAMVQGTAGATYDGLGHEWGPIGSVGLIVGKRGKPQASVSYSHYFSSQNTTSEVDSFVFDVKIPF